MTGRATRWWIPLVGSFAVYLVPLLGPHAVWLLGESLIQGLTHPGDRETAWLVTNFALALAVQVTVGLMLAWSLRGPSLRFLVWIPTTPILTIGLNLAYLSAIPSYFLIEPDLAPQVMSWEEHCFVPGVSLMSIRTPANRTAGGVGEWWLQKPDGGYALLRLPDCLAIDANIPAPFVRPDGRANFIFGFQFAVPGGAATLERLVPSTSEQSWWLLTEPTASLISIPQPELAQGSPVLADAGDVVAWLQRVAMSGPPVLERILIQALRPSMAFDRVSIELAPFGPASYTLLSIDTVNREAVLWRNDRPLVVGFDGLERENAFTPGNVRPQASSYLRRRDGWLAWDGYRDTDPYRYAWSLDGRSGTGRTNKGRSITSAAVDPSGMHVAISETTTLSIGSAGDVVYVIRTSDGADVFRRLLPRYSRSQVVFFEGGLFGYSEPSGTHILKVPR